MTADDIAVLDTDVASSLHRHRYLGRPLDASLADLIGEYRPVISVITLGEARYGIARAKWGPKRSDQLFAYYHRSFAILPVDETVADEYGRLRPSPRPPAALSRTTTSGSPRPQRRPRSH